MRRPLLFALLLFPFAASAAAPAATLEQIRLLAEGGAPGLALQTLDRAQAPAAGDTQAWMRWERERLRILQASGEWQGIADRLARLPAGLPVDFRRQALTLRAQAWLELGNGGAARGTLRELLWDPALSDPAQQRQLRRMVVHSYLVDARADDAALAVARLQQDYPSSEPADLLLRARVALLSGHPGSAVQLLGKGEAKPAAAEALLLLAQLRSGDLPPRRVTQAALQRIRGEAPEADSVRFWAIAAEAATQGGDLATGVNALEHVLAADPQQVLAGDLYHFDADRLWAGYLGYAGALGNRAQYLIGDDARWLQAAGEAARHYPVRARSLYAMVVRHGQTQAARERAARALVASLDGRSGGDRLLRALFLHARAYPELADVPVAVRRRLVDLALADSDIKLASRLMATLEEPPAEADRFRWGLRRARILVMGGQAAAGARALEGLLDSSGDLDEPHLRHLLQVVFDLQTVGEHQRALDLFTRILGRSQGGQFRRELLYWMAESEDKLGHPLAAARLYLRSALLPGPATMDPWAQTARFQAAKALAEGGMVGDARRLLEQLLEVTKETGRRAVLQRELEGLWLVRKPAAQSVASPQDPAVD